MLKPKCLDGRQSYGYTNVAGGYILPCCLCDKKDRYKDFKSLMQEKFKITNVDSIEEILHSEEWQEFYDILINRPGEAPDVCQKFCSNHFVKKDVTYIHPKTGKFQNKKY
jgi:hypothetical protein